jgi:TolB-like protein/Tfp pilus assembly protein PilF
MASGAVFLSYASEDSAAAASIADALKAAGIEVWFDKSELRGGDAWDQSIRRKIRECRLFIPIISANTQARLEGYFRREWKLAVDRTEDMAGSVAFLVPVAIDETPEAAAEAPERFRAVQWTRLPRGRTPPEFVERVRRLLSPGAPVAAPLTPAMPPGTAHGGCSSTGRSGKRHSLLWAAFAIAAALTLVIVIRLQPSRAVPPAQAADAAANHQPATDFNPPPHSIAVLPFANLSRDANQDYFSDGLTEELLNALAEINDLQVAARTSSFYFKGKDIDLATIARTLNVGAVLEGSVRRSAHTVRITAQLINTVTGFHLWSKTYDRSIGDVLKLQTEIATAVADALKVTLLGDISQRIELGGTRNSAALDAYLRATKAYRTTHEQDDDPAAIAAYSEAIRLDPSFALAFAGRSLALSDYAAAHPDAADGFKKAESDALQAIALAPELAEGHVALASVAELGTLDFAHSRDEYERAVALAPGNALVLLSSGRLAARMGHFDAGIAFLRRAVVLDPLDREAQSSLGSALYSARRYPEAVAAFEAAIRLDPNYKIDYGYLGLALYELGDLDKARAACETKQDHWASQWCLSLVYEQLGRHADAGAESAKLKSAAGDGAAYQYSSIYAQWGDRSKALDWLDTAMRIHDSGLELLKTDPLMDPLRNEPRFQAAMRELKFPG